MKITTPTATLGIRGTTGLVEVPEGAAANNPHNVAVKLYPDADGRVGRIEVNDRAGARLGFLTQGASGFTIRPAPAACASPRCRWRFRKRRCCATRALCASFTRRRMSAGRSCSSSANSAAPIRPSSIRTGRSGNSSRPAAEGCRPAAQNGLPGQPGQPPLPGAPNRPGQQQPGQLNRPGQQQPGQLNRPGQQQQPGAAGPPGTAADRARRCDRAACRRAQDNRPEPICRRSPACRHAPGKRNSLTCPRNRAPIRNGGRDCRTGTASPDCSARPASGKRRPCDDPNGPLRQGGPRPCRDEASRRQGNCANGEARRGSRRAPQPVVDPPHQAPRPRLEGIRSSRPGEARPHGRWQAAAAPAPFAAASAIGPTCRRNERSWPRDSRSTASPSGSQSTALTSRISLRVGVCPASMRQ